MALTLEELCRNSENDYGMMLIAGEKGTDNIVQWVHYIEGGEVPRFLHGYELVFTTGIAHQDTGWFTLTLHTGFMSMVPADWVIDPRAVCKKHTR